MEFPKPTDGIIVQEMGDDCLVYDPGEGSVHLLNQPMALVLGACVGATSESEMMQNLKVAPDVDAQMVVEKILLELEAVKLLQPRSTGAIVKVNVRRRQFIKMATMAMTPLVISTIAPAPVAAASCPVSCGAAALGAPCAPAGGCLNFCWFQYTCNDLVNPLFVTCDPASSCLTGDFKNPVLLCVLPNITNIQLNCATARANAVTTGFNQGTYICQNCP